MRQRRMRMRDERQTSESVRDTGEQRRGEERNSGSRRRTCGRIIIFLTQCEGNETTTATETDTESMRMRGNGEEVSHKHNDDEYERKERNTFCRRENKINGFVLRFR
jgi:hypothetical protein